MWSQIGLSVWSVLHHKVHNRIALDEKEKTADTIKTQLSKVSDRFAYSLRVCFFFVVVVFFGTTK